MLTTVLCFVACQKEHSRRDGDGGGTGSGDSDFDYGNVTGKHIVQETAVNMNGETVEVRYFWNDTKLMKISIQDSLDIKFNYTDNLLTSMTYDFGGMIQEYSIAYLNGRIVTISTNVSGIEQSYAFEYNGNEISVIRSVMNVAGYPIATTTYLSWSNGNLIYKVDDNNTIRYYYDSHPTPYALDFPKAFFLALQMPEMMSVNNVERIDTLGRTLRQVNWTYTTDGYPASNGRSEVGFNYYLYADGDGSTGNASNPTSLVDTKWGYTDWESYYGYSLTFLTENTGVVTYSNSNAAHAECNFSYTYSDGNGSIFVHDTFFDFYGEIPFSLNGEYMLVNTTYRNIMFVKYNL